MIHGRPLGVVSSGCLRGILSLRCVFFTLLALLRARFGLIPRSLLFYWISQDDAQILDPEFGIFLTDIPQNALLTQLEHLHPAGVVRLDDQYSLFNILGFGVTGEFRPHQLVPVGKKGVIRACFSRLLFSQKMFEEFTGFFYIL